MDQAALKKLPRGWKSIPSELVSYNTGSGGGGGGGGTLNNIVEDTTPQLGGNLDLFNKTITGTGGINMTGVVTAT